MVAQELSSQEREHLLLGAPQSVESAYAPDARFTVGAAPLSFGGKSLPGGNLENAADALANGAARRAIFSAIAELLPGGFRLQ